MSEHRMTDVLSMVDRVLFLDGGRIAFNGKPGSFAGYLLDRDLPFRAALPAATKAVRRLEEETGQSAAGPPSLDVPAARRRLRQLAPLTNPPEAVPEARQSREVILEAKELFFRYQAGLPEVLKGASLVIEEASIHAVIGGNGSGKSTLLHLLSGLLDPVSGKVKKRSGIRTGLLTQHTQALFSADALFEELMELSELGGYGREEVLGIMERFGLEGLADRHPYDLSGGEIQKAALAKLLLLSPDLLLLDEPVKGMDSASKEQFSDCLRTLASEGKTVVLVTHDLNFSAETADTCSLLFDGRIVATEAARPFFRGNTFYTTDYARVTEGIIPDIITAADLQKIRKAGHED